MVENTHFLLKYRYECCQGESGYRKYHNDSNHATDFRGPGVLFLIVQRCPILTNGDLIKAGEPARAVDSQLIFCLRVMDLRGFWLDYFLKISLVLD
jgi:hypothetical protein